MIVVHVSSKFDTGRFPDSDNSGLQILLADKWAVKFAKSSITQPRLTGPRGRWIVKILHFRSNTRWRTAPKFNL